MPTSKEITYSKILAIKLPHHQNDVITIAIIDDETRQLDNCGLLMARSNHLEAHQVFTNLANNIRQCWKEKSAPYNEPRIICIFYPDQYDGWSMFEKQQYIFLDMLCAEIESRFKARLHLRPRPKTMGNLQTRRLYEEWLDVQGKGTLATKLNNVPQQLRQHVIDTAAIAMMTIDRKSRINVPVPTNEQIGTRVFQKLAQPLFHAPETNFFPANEHNAAGREEVAT